MSDRQHIDSPPRRDQNPHDVAMAVLRPEIYTEAADWLRETNPGLTAQNAGFNVALDKLAARAKDAKAQAPGLLDHVTAAYYRQAADSLENAGHYGSARLLRHVADDLDGGSDV